MNEQRSEKNYGLLALLPLGVFLVLYVGCGLVFTIAGVPEAFTGTKPFNIMTRYVAAISGVLVGILLFDRKKKVEEKAEIYYKSAGTPGVMTLALIVILAGGFSGACSAIGGKASFVNLGASLIPAQFLIPGIFIMCAIVSTCIGTSMGTVSVMIPVAVALAETTGLNLGMVAAAVLTGSTFGDNLSMISDTTIAATKGVGADMRDKFRMNFTIALPAAILTIIFYTFVGLKAGTVGTADIGDYNILTILPYIVVLILAIAGLDVIVVLTLGILLAGVIGMLCGTATFFQWAAGISSGMEGMFWLAIFAMMISGMVGLVRYFGGLDWLVEKAKKLIHSSRSCEYIVGLFPMLLSTIIANNTLAILISGPVAKDLGEKHNVAPKRLASLLDIGACLGAMVVPHGTCMQMVEEAAGADYFSVIKYEYYPLFLLIATIITIQFGLLKSRKADK